MLRFIVLVVKLLKEFTKLFSLIYHVFWMLPLCLSRHIRKWEQVYICLYNGLILLHLS